MISPATANLAKGKSIIDVAVMMGAPAAISQRPNGWPCPGCGGNDRFSVDKRKNLFFCRHSGIGGDPIDLVIHVHGVNYQKAVEMLTGAHIPKRENLPDLSDKYRQEARARGYKIWQNGRPAGDLIEEYFRIRSIPFPTWRLRTIRQSARLLYWSKVGEKFEVIHEGPAMLGAITGPDGKFIGVHRTWLDFGRTAGKAEITHPQTGEILGAKKVEGSVKCGKIVLREGDRVAVGEGVETVLSWDALRGNGEALWSGVSLGNIAGRAVGRVKHPTLKVKGGQRAALVGNDEPLFGDPCLKGPVDVLIADADTSDMFTARLDMERARKRLGGEIDWPPEGKDWNDVLSV